MPNQVERKWCRSLTIMDYPNFLQLLSKSKIKYIYPMLCLISDTKKYLFFPPLCHTYFCFPSQADGHVQLVEGRESTTSLNRYACPQVVHNYHSWQSRVVIPKGVRIMTSSVHQKPSEQEAVDSAENKFSNIFVCFEYPSISPELTCPTGEMAHREVSYSFPYHGIRGPRKWVMCAHTAFRSCPPLGVGTDSFHLKMSPVQQILLPIKQAPFTIALRIKL